MSEDSGSTTLLINHFFFINRGEMLRSSLEYDQELRSELINYHLHFVALVIHDGIVEKLPQDFAIDTFVNY